MWKSSIVFIFLINFAFLSSVPCATIQNNFDIPLDLYQNVSKENLRNIVGNLSSFTTRETGTQGCMDAAAYIYNWIDSNTNATASFVNWTWNNHPIQTVVGTIQGNQSFIIISAHYDSVSDTANAPGANDDASGIAAGLECLRILSNYSKIHSNFTHSIIFLAFAGEEQALAGSRNWIQNNLDKRILAVINLDTIGYGTGQSLIYNLESEWFASNLLESIRSLTLFTYVIKKSIVYPDNSVGDHQSFWNHYIPAIWMYEDGPTYPYFHTANDISSNINYDLVVDAVKIVNTGIYFSDLQCQSINYGLNIIFLIVFLSSLIGIIVIIVKKNKLKEHNLFSFI